MAIENVVANAGAGGSSFAVDAITAGVLVPYTKLMSGTDASEELIGGDAANGLDVDVTRVSGTVAVSNAGLTELAAAINASSQMDVNIAASGATVPVSNAGLTELAAAINASSQMDVNLAASNATVTVTGAGGSFPVTDSAGSLTVDAPVGTPVFVRLSDGAAAITTLAVSLASVPSHAVTNAGTFAVQVDGDALTALQLIDDPVLVDDAGFTPATSKVMMAGYQADETATDSVDEGDAGAARMTLDRKLITSPQPHTAGGLSISRDIDLDNGTLTVVKNAAGQLYGWTITNTGTVTVYVKFYDATSGTLGTGTPVLTIGIPGNATDDTLAMQSFGGLGIAFGTGICVGAGTGVADADNTDPGSNVVIANIYYK